MAEKNAQVELIPKEGSAIEQVESHLPVSPFDQLMERSRDPNFDKDNFNTMVAFMEKREALDAKNKFNMAMSEFQSECPQVRKIKPGGKGNYAPFEYMMQVVQPYLKKHKIAVSFTFPPSEKKGIMHVVGSVSIGTHSEKSEFEIAENHLPTSKGGSNSQDTGSTLSYAKRYCIKNMLNIVEVGEDLDGVTSGGSISKDEANAIEALIGDIEQELGKNFNITGWRKYLKIDENTPIEDIPKSVYSRATNSLKGKLNELRKGKSQ